MESMEKKTSQERMEKKLSIEYSEVNDGNDDNANSFQVITNQRPYSVYTSDYSLGLLSLTTSLIALFIEIINQFDTLDWMSPNVANVIEIILLLIFITLAVLVLMQIWCRSRNLRKG